MLHMLRQLIFAALATGLIVAPVALAAKTQSSNQDGITLTAKVKEAMSQGKKVAKAGKIILPNPRKNTTATKAAQKTADYFYSQHFQKKVAKERAKIERYFKGNGKCTAFASNSSTFKETERDKYSLIKGKIYLFLSSSMPKETIHNYLLDIQLLGDPSLVPVMRGMVNGLQDKKANVRFFSQVLKEDPACWDEPKNRCKRFKTDVLFQPPLFKKYSVDQVPTVVYVTGKDNVYKIEGDSSLAYLLKRINEAAKHASLKKIIRKLQ